MGNYSSSKKYSSSIATKYNNINEEGIEDEISKASSTMSEIDHIHTLLLRGSNSNSNSNTRILPSNKKRSIKLKCKKEDNNVSKTNNELLNDNYSSSNSSCSIGINSGYDHKNKVAIAQKEDDNKLEQWYYNHHP